MSAKSLMLLATAVVTAGLLIEPPAANAAGLAKLAHGESPQGLGATLSNLTCGGLPGIGANVPQ